MCRSSRTVVVGKEVQLSLAPKEYKALLLCYGLRNRGAKELARMLQISRSYVPLIKKQVATQFAREGRR